MDIRKRPDLPRQAILPKQPDGAAEGVSKGLPRPPIKLDRDRLEFQKRDEDKNGALTSDEYGVGKKKQGEFRRYDSNDDGKVDFKEFKLGRFLDKLRNGDIDIKPVPMPFPKLPEDGNMPIPMPVPNFPDIKPVPMPFPKIPGLKFPDIKPIPFPKIPDLDLPNIKPRGPVFLAGEASVGDLVAKVKQAKDENL